MILQIFLGVFFIFSFIAALIGGECVPRAVLNLTLSSNGTLSWTVSPQESCDIIHFHVNIHRQGQGDYDLYVGGTTADVSFLPFCQSWVFTVRAASEDSSSLGHILISRIPMPPDADITIKYLNVTEVDSNLQLIWDLEDDTIRYCADSYRVTINDEDNGKITDLYVIETFYSLEFLSPCVAYEFGVRAINSGRPTEEGPLRSIEYDIAPTRQNPPRLQAVSVGSTTANTTWLLDSPSVNRCPIRTFNIDGGQYFNISLPVVETPDRGPVLVTLNSLRPNSMYILRASIENSGGMSSANIVGVQTLDMKPGSF